LNITESHRIIKFNHKSSGSSLFGSIGPSYYGEVLSVEPRQSAGDEDVVITGRAVDRATELPMADVPLKLVISVAGFERVNQVFTDVMGSFGYAFKPLAGKAGLYKVCGPCTRI
jgi:large repetitive protein